MKTSAQQEKNAEFLLMLYWVCETEMM